MNYLLLPFMFVYQNKFNNIHKYWFLMTPKKFRWFCAYAIYGTFLFNIFSFYFSQYVFEESSSIVENFKNSIFQIFKYISE